MATVHLYQVLKRETLKVFSKEKERRRRAFLLRLELEKTFDRKGSLQ
ncbi:MAG: hypothetical protein NZM36_04040 [Aquificaceae bacterium]|nr:hypothetical protein [Aquificaceae bacterium]